ncbi:MAG: hypothetical protein ABII74_07155 [Elusimicrobiota bacterium]
MKTMEKDLHYYYNRAIVFFVELERIKNQAADQTMRSEINHKLLACEVEIKNGRKQELLKSAQANFAKDKLSKAIDYYREADELFPENWIKEKIGALRKQLLHKNLLLRAGEAERTSHFMEAAQFYREYLNNNGNEGMIVFKCAICFLKANKTEDGKEIFKKLPADFKPAELTQPELYDYGYLLALAGKYREGLKIWDSIQRSDVVFLQQKELLEKLIISDLYKNIKDKNSVDGIYLTAKFIRRAANDQKFKGIADYLIYSSVERLWSEEKYQDIYELLTPYPQRVNSKLLAIYAKLFFKLSEETGQYLSELTLFWLSAVYNPEISAKLAASEQETEKVQEFLLGEVEKIINKQLLVHNHQTKNKVLLYWNLEKRIINKLRNIIADRKELYCLIQTPRFANRFGFSESILQLIKDNRDHFANIEEYFTFGAYYTKAGESLLAIESENFEQVKNPVQFELEEANEFVQFAAAKMNFKYGLYAIEIGNKNYERFFSSLPFLLERAPGLEKELIDKAMEEHQAEKLAKYEEIVNNLYRRRQNKEIKETLSHLMVKQGLISFNNDKISIDVFKSKVQKALKLNPDDEYALAMLEEADIGQQNEQVISLLEKAKIGRATEIVLESKHQKVREIYFECLEEVIEETLYSDVGDEAGMAIINNILKWASQVDETHPLILKLKRLLRTNK